MSLDIPAHFHLLNEEFAHRRSKNQSYSLRAFAAHLDVTPTFLSYVLRGKRRLSSDKARIIARRLKWSQTKRNFFLSLLEYEKSTTDSERADALLRIQKFNRPELQTGMLDPDVFETVAKWHYTAILTLLMLTDIKADIDFIRRRLNLSLSETEKALLRLQRLGLVKARNGFWTATKQFLRIHKAPSLAIRLFHKDLLSKAAKALDEQNAQERDFSNLTFLVDVDEFELAKQKVLEFQKEMTQLLSGKNPTEVYQMSIQLFRLTQKNVEAT